MDDARYVLYGTGGCHLCEEAESLLLTLARSRPLAWRGQDIIEDEALVTRYGEAIPVLYDRQDQRELRWPFGLLDLVRWVR